MMVSDALWQLDSKAGPATFDFYTWLPQVKKLGAKRIIINDEIVRTKKFSESVIRKRVETIIKPGPALAGLPWRTGRHGRIIGTYRMADLAKLGEFERLKSVLPPQQVRYTVTLRKFGHRPYRNSNEVLWREFAERICAHVIEDWHEKPIDLHERVALYAGAEMNFGVTNGPLWLLFMTPYPVTMFDCNAVAPLWDQHGIKPGTQLPWALPNQRLVWEHPTMDDLMAAVP